MNLIALATLGPLIFLKIVFSQVTKGVFGILLKLAVGFGAAIAISYVSPICPALALLLVAVAIIFGEFFGTLALYLGPHIPFIGDSVAAAISPIQHVIFIILILNVVLFILNILTIFSFIPVVGWIIPILDIVIPLIIVYLIWNSYSQGIAGIKECFGMGSSVEVPGTGGIKIGT
ncbi:MAG: hypothetical protein J7K22_02940 [Nanoarchaeota archaeon]|nr:hypothetical protein [Nanoarchaeota archaeon]